MVIVTATWWIQPTVTMEIMIMLMTNDDEKKYGETKYRAGTKRCGDSS